MEELLRMIGTIHDCRQQAKVRHKLVDVFVIVLFATLANANEWEEIEEFAREYEDFIREYVELENGIPSHDTIERVMAIISPKELGRIQIKWQEVMVSEEGEKIRKVVNIDGKTMRGNAGKEHKANHIVSAWCDEDGFCLGEEKVDEKSNEITAIPMLLNKINVKNSIVTIDAMGTQTTIVDSIRRNKADYVLAVKENQHNLYAEISQYLNDADFRKEIREGGQYLKQTEKSHGQLEIREYYQTEHIGWMQEKKRWIGIKSIGCIEKTIVRNGEKIVETRYYISSLGEDVEQFARSVRQHWSVEIMHWHLDVTFKEDANKTIEEVASQNMNIIRKWCLSILKLLNMGKNMSLKRKRYKISLNPCKYIKQIMEM